MSRYASAPELIQAKKSYWKEVGRRLARARNAADGAPSQADVARSVGLTQPTWNAYESGATEANPFFVERFCRKYGFTCSWVYEGLTVANVDSPNVRRLAEGRD